MNFGADGPWDDPSLSLFHTLEVQFVLGTSWDIGSSFCPWCKPGWFLGQSGAEGRQNLRNIFDLIKLEMH